MPKKEDLPMGKRLFLITAVLVLLSLLCCGCGSTVQDDTATSAATTEPTVPATVPEDGNPDDVTCKGTYTADSIDAKATVATAGSHTLTAEQLQIWYQLTVAEYAQGDYDTAPDFSRPLDTQPCPVDGSVNSWQQYFLNRALNTWYSVCALELHSRTQPLPVEEAYKPNLDNYATYMTDMPAAEFLYRYNTMYEPNTMHAAYLDSIPETLTQLAKDKGYSSVKELAAAFGVSEKALKETVRLYNFSYAYFTTLGYYEDNSDLSVQLYMDAQDNYNADGYTVDIRHILVVPHDPIPEPEPPVPAWKKVETVPTEPTLPPEPQVFIADDGTVTCPEERWDACMAEAEGLLASWKADRRCSASTFSELAVKQSADAGSALNGGNYRSIRKGQLMKELDDWCFDPARQAGDTTILRSPYGCHILYFDGTTADAFAQAKEDLTLENLRGILTEAQELNPLTVDYSAIVLLNPSADVSASDVLYPDIAHERFPEIPLYLQQDYASTMYGAYLLRTNGCGITTMAMLASYMADDELTPPEMCERYGHYSHRNGTDGMIFQYEPAVMGFYLREVTYDYRVAKEALDEGQIVVSVQHKGYWTGGGHYIALEKVCDDGRIQVRDSNIYNYRKIISHKEDRHTWGSIIADGSGFWIYEDKITRIPACSRCGTQEGMEASHLEEAYLCEKCTPAVLRRSAYLSICSENP